MKKYIAIIAAGLILLSCRKTIHQDGIISQISMIGSSDSVSADIDGVHYKFNTKRNFTAGTYLIYGGGATEYQLSTSDSNNISIYFIYPGDHAVYAKTYDSTEAVIAISLAADQQYYTNNLTVPSKSINIVVTYATDSSVTGTFEGTVYKYVSDSTPYLSKVITNGKFYTGQ